MTRGDRLTLTIEKPAAGGRMIARHQGAIVLVAAAIPGEVVEAVVDKVQRGTAWARTLRVVDRSPDRVEPLSDSSCGGNVLSHVRYERQLDLKRQIVRDAFARIGRLAVPDDVPVTPSPVDGYRMRARLHVENGRVGFFREGTHQLCDPASTHQLLPTTIDALRELETALTGARLDGIREVELSENVPADERVLHLVLDEHADPSRLGERVPRLAAVTGVSCGNAFATRALGVWGTPTVTDGIAIAGPSGDITVRLTRHAHAFFQGNRFLLAPLVQTVSELAAADSVLDLYAGVGLFAVALALRGTSHVVAIEGDRTAAHDLKHNASNASGAIEARHQPVEAYLQSRPRRFDTVIVDPPRTGMTKEAFAGAVRIASPRIVYVSCDVATLARDARMLADAGYQLTSLQAFDLFPNTAHVESVAVFQGG